MKHLAMLLVLFFAVVSPAAADEKDAETRFHEAYVQEVIEGEIEAAARTYLALMEDEEAPPRIRAESRFRFAVCAALLGRADEARAQLAALRADDATPPALRARAEEYLASIAALDVGSEVDRMLQSLVFDLGREHPDNPAPAVYRDFEIIGEAAVPFLLRLLDHRDEPMRRHAFRILCRMDAKGVGRAWRPDVRILAHHFANDFGDYLRRHPEEVPDFEQGLLALDDDALQAALVGFHTPRFPFTAEFVTKLAARPGVRRAAVDLLRRVEDESQRLALAQELLRAEDAELRTAVRQTILHAPGLVEDPATRREFLLSWLRSDDLTVVDHVAGVLLAKPELLPDPLDRDVYESLVRYARRDGGVWDASHVRDSPSFGLTVRSDAQPAATAFAVLRDVVEAGLRRDQDGTHPERGVLTFPERGVVTAGLADLLAASVERRPASEIDLESYATMVKRWVGAVPHAKHLRWLVEHLPQAEADALGRWVMDEVVHLQSIELGDQAYDLLDVFEVESVAALRRWRAAFAGTQDEEVRAWLLDLLPRSGGEASPELQRAIVLLRPELIRKMDDEEAAGIGRSLRDRTAEMDSAEAARAIAAVLKAVVERPAAVRAEFIDNLTWVDAMNRDHDYVEFVAGVWPGVVREAWAVLPSEDREHCLATLYEAWKVLPDENLSANPDLAAFLREHLGEPGTDWELVARHPEAFPLTTWVPIAPTHAISYIVYHRNDEIIFTEAEIDAAARELTRDATKVNRSIMAFVARSVTPRRRTEILDQLLASGSSEARGLVLERRNLIGWLSSQVKGLEAALDDLLAEKEPDLDQLRIVASRLEPLKPTKKLIPAARILLGSTLREDVLAGIHLAESLASHDLRPELQELYVSTLDRQIRTAAQEALHVIDHLAAVRAGTRPP